MYIYVQLKNVYICALCIHIKKYVYICATKICVYTCNLSHGCVRHDLLTCIMSAISVLQCVAVCCSVLQ